jgi:hypothetical protein
MNITGNKDHKTFMNAKTYFDDLVHYALYCMKLTRKQIEIAIFEKHQLQ